jgi:quercetin 2,3-dioxygenase
MVSSSISILSHYHNTYVIKLQLTNNPFNFLFYITFSRKPSAHWVGDGFNVFPVFANKAFTNELSPFLMFDYAAPKEFKPTNKRLGVGQHPHRGFETVTLAFEGEVEHGDSEGNRGVIKEGDIQWMTAASGIVHQEFHSTEFAKRGGLFEMCQLWVNLPAKKKMIPAQYQEIKNASVPKEKLVSESCSADANGPESTEDDGFVRVIAGNYNGVTGAANTHSPVNMWDVRITNTERIYDFEISAGHTTLIFIRKGKVDILGKSLNLADVAIMSLDGTKVSLRATDPDTKVLILSGEPLNEPIAAQGPFVMNTQKELYEAMDDYQNSRNGFKHFRG